MIPIKTKVMCEICEHNLIREQTKKYRVVQCEILENGEKNIMFVEDHTVKCRSFKEAEE